MTLSEKPLTEWWQDRLMQQRQMMVAQLLSLASLEEDLARTFRAVAATSPHRAERLLAAAATAADSASRQEATARRFAGLAAK